MITSVSNGIPNLGVNFLTTLSPPDDATSSDTDSNTNTDTDTETATTTSTTTPTNGNSTESFFDSTNSGLEMSLTTSEVLKLNLRDFRSLFYIPEVESNGVIAENKKEVILPVGKNDLMKFLDKSKKSNFEFPCPSHCDPRYLDSDTCHPCISVK